MQNNQRLFAYIRKARKQGASRSKITQSLLNAGWRHEDIELAFDVAEKGSQNFLHVHLFHKHISSKISALFLVGIVLVTGLIAFVSAKEGVDFNKLFIQHAKYEEKSFVYGSTPALENADFFEKVKQDFITQEADFIEADLSTMILRVFKEGVVAAEVPIMSKGKEDSWWETPAGLYQMGVMEKEHFSSFGHVYMPWSMQFQGNFFIHGWPYYSDGTKVPKGYSGGCIRLSDADAETVFKLSETEMPILVFKESFYNQEDTAVQYAQKKLLPGSASYIVADLQNNFVFAKSGSPELRSIASLTKIVTALVAVEYINVEKKVLIDPSMIATTSIQRLKEGDHISILDLLSLLLVESSNEAARAIATPLGRQRFVELMNRKAKAIGMQNSYFEDTSGEHADNVSTAEDLFSLAKYLYYNRSFILHMTMQEEERAAYGTSQFQNLSNLNEIPGIDNMIGGKTGLSTNAKDCMLAVFEIEIGGQKRPIAIIVLGSDDAKQDVKTLYHSLQENFDIETNER